MHNSGKENINSKCYVTVMQPRMNLANKVHAILKGPLGDDVLIEIKFGGICHSDIHQ